MQAKEGDVSCWHGHGHGCGPVYHGSAPRGWRGPVDEYDVYEDVDWPRRRRFRERAGERDSPEASLEMRLQVLHEEIQRMEAALADLARPSRAGTAE